MFGRLKMLKKRRMDRTFPFLPETETYPMNAPEPPTEGWWRDPFKADLGGQRYHDGTRWTQYVAGRTAREWTSVYESPPPTDA